MLTLKKPSRLRIGDTVATVSLSWGGAGDSDLIWRYEKGKRRLMEQFGLHVVEMPHTLKGTDYVYCHPEKRAEDLMQAFQDPNIRAIFACIGGDDSIRMLPYIDFDIIRQNPKIFLGYSDSTITHFLLLKAGVAGIYGPSILAEFAENVKIYDYTAHWLSRTLFETNPLGVIPCADVWTGERMSWTIENENTAKAMKKNTGYEFLQGEGTVQGPLIGGCIEVMEMIKGTRLWPDAHQFDNAVLFFETSEDMPDPKYITYWLRNYGCMGILNRAAGIVWGKPYQGVHYHAYKQNILKVLSELSLDRLPVVYNMSFGHNEPMSCIPYGALAKIDCQAQTFSILESGVCNVIV